MSCILPFSTKLKLNWGHLWHEDMRLCQQCSACNISDQEPACKDQECANATPLIKPSLYSQKLTSYIRIVFGEFGINDALSAASLEAYCNSVLETREMRSTVFLKNFKLNRDSQRLGSAIVYLTNSSKKSSVSLGGIKIVPERRSGRNLNHLKSSPHQSQLDASNVVAVSPAKTNIEPWPRHDLNAGKP